MALLPYALRPKVVLRGQIIKHGVVRGNPVFRPVAMLLVGQGAYLRRSAVRQGLVLGRPLWRVIGLALLAQEFHRIAIKRQHELLAVERIRPGRHVSVAVFEPTLGLSRRQRRVALRRLESEAVASIEARSRS
jgi:hypothetical protein